MPLDKWIVTVTFDNGETEAVRKGNLCHLSRDSGNVILEMGDKSPRIVYSNDSLRSLEYEENIGNKVEDRVDFNSYGANILWCVPTTGTLPLRIIRPISCMECNAAPRCKYRGRCVHAIFDGAPIRNSSQITNEIAYELEQKES